VGFGGRDGRATTECEGKPIHLLTLAHPSAQGACEKILGEKSGGCHLLGNARDLKHSWFLGAFGPLSKLRPSEKRRLRAAHHLSFKCISHNL